MCISDADLLRVDKYLFNSHRDTEESFTFWLRRVRFGIDWQCTCWALWS